MACETYLTERWFAFGSVLSSFETLLIGQTAAIRAYAVFLTGGWADADDLVQDTLEKAWRSRDQFEAGSNLKAWLLAILRNTHYNGWRHSKRTLEDVNGARAARLTVEPAQGWHLEFTEALTAIADLDEESRHSLLLITAGLSYEEAATVCGCPLRTLQSRVRRARERLTVRLADDAVGFRKPDRPRA